MKIDLDELAGRAAQNKLHDLTDRELLEAASEAVAFVAWHQTEEGTRRFAEAVETAAQAIADHEEMAAAISRQLGVAIDDVDDLELAALNLRGYLAGNGLTEDMYAVEPGTLVDAIFRRIADLERAVTRKTRACDLLIAAARDLGVDDLAARALEIETVQTKPIVNAWGQPPPAAIENVPHEHLVPNGPPHEKLGIERQILRWAHGYSGGEPDPWAYPCDEECPRSAPCDCSSPLEDPWVERSVGVHRDHAREVARQIDARRERDKLGTKEADGAD